MAVQQQHKNMLYRRLGNSGLFISVFGLGGWMTYGGYVGKEKAFACMKQAYECGINFFDTAEVYADGESEIVMGEAIRKYAWKRSDLVVSTKLYWGTGNGQNPITNNGLSRKHIIEGTRASLDRLGLEYVDLIYAHRPDRLTPIEETVRAFNFVIEKGWAFYWGTSKWSADEIQEACGIAKSLGLIAPIVEQPCYNMLERQLVEGEYQRLYARYGATERKIQQCPRCTSSGTVSDFRSIGHALGANLVHIVDRNDHNKLLPIGMVGELVIEGPIVGRGYLNDQAKTRSVFLDNTAWLQRLDRDRSWRLYKTGDLAQYNADGSITYLGRKDTTVKLHGQRLELQDVEHQLRRCFDNSSFLVADVVLQGNNPILTAFVLFGDEADQEGPLFGEKDAPFCAEVAKAQAHMKQQLPIYMVPTAFIPLARVPLTKTGKTDRRTLRSEAAKLPRHKLLEHGVMQQGTKAAVKLNPDETVALQVSQRLVQLTADQSATEWLQDRDVNLSQAGLDSIDTMSLSMFIRRTFGVALPPGTLNNSAVTVREIARYIEAVTAATPTEDLFDTVDLLAEVEALNAQLAQLHDPNAAHPPIKAPRVFFVTGGTGFLGSEILRQLLIRPQTTKVIAHVRARNQEDAMARIIHSARVGQWWHEDLQSRLEVWVGDLIQPQLGLEDRLWTYLSGKTRDKQPVDAIIHCGTAVYWEADYMALKAANVTSTFDLLALVGQSPEAPRFTFVSGGRSEMEEIDDRSAAASLSQSSGYSQTKFVAELLVKEYIKRQPGCRVSVLKPALIIGDADRGVSNTDDFIWRAVAAAIRAGGFNSCESNAWMAVAGVDQVAASVIGMCLQNEPGVVHLLDRISLGDFWSTVCHNLPFNLTPMEADKWLQEVQEDVERSGQDHVLWPVLSWLESGGGYLGFPPPSKYNPILDGELIKASVRASLLYLKDVGYLAGRGAAGCTTSLVFKRSER